MKKFISLFLIVVLAGLFVAPKQVEATFTIPQVTICHVPGESDFTMSVPVTALFGHLGHGDYLGACQEGDPEVTPTPTPEPTPEVTPTPTPDPCQPQDLELKILLDEVEEPCPTPTPEPEQPKVETGSSPFHQPEAPVCTDGNTNGAVANPHVIRNGTEATVNFVVTDGDKAHVFYKENGQDNWTHSVANVGVNQDKFGTVKIGSLNPNLGYTFGIMQVKGCGGGTITAVVVDPPANNQLFQLSYWLFN